jgi:beta-glucosidase
VRLLVRSLTVVLFGAMLLPAQAGDDSVILRRLTPRQQVQIERGAQNLAQNGRIAGVPAASLPGLAMSDASTSVASPEIVAASWDVVAAHAYGEALARQALELGTNVVGVPVNALGEDPLLAAHLAAPLVRGMQSAHAIAALFGGASGSADDRAIHEMQWPAVESAIAEGKAGAVTCALRDGRTATLCNDRALATLLSRDVRFDGFGIAMPAGNLTAPARVLTAMRRAHLLSHTTGLPETAGDALSRRLVQSGSVLLKNDAGVLPLDPRSVGSLAVIGGDEPTLAALRAALPQSRIATAGLDDAGTAVRVARDQAACLIVLGSEASAAEDAVVAAVAGANPRTAVVLERKITSAPAWTGTVAAVLLSWAPVVGTPAAVANLVTGVAAPSGRLPVTIGSVGAPAPAPEGLLRGYRAYVAAHEAPAFSFGSGLTYTSFAYSSLKVAYGRTAAAPVSVSFVVANTGSRSGIVVPQLYLGFPAQSGEPSKVLADFARITLAAGQRRRISMPLWPRSFAYWSKGYKAWFVAPGTYWATVGSSVADVALRGDIQIVAK